MDDIDSELKNIMHDTVRKLEESTRAVEACTQEIKEQNRKARFIAQCLGIEP